MVHFAPLGTQIAEELRGEIVAGVLGRGDRVVENELADRFDVSRGPVRDAIKQLVTEGLVETRRGKAYVLGVTAGDVRELYSLREALETVAMRRVVERRDRIDWSPFDAALDAMREAASVRDARAFGTADLEFHAAFYRASGHRRVSSMWSQFQPTFLALLHFNAQDRDLYPSVAMHVDLLATVQQGDITKLLARLSSHLDQAEARITANLRSIRTDTAAPLSR